MHPFLKQAVIFRLPDYKSGPFLMYAVNNPYLPLENPFRLLLSSAMKCCKMLHVTVFGIL